VSGVVVLQTLVNGLLLGGVYALIALGLTLIFGVLHVINLGHGALVTLGAYTGVVFVSMTKLDPLLALPVAALVGFGVGVIIERLVVDSLIGGPLFTSAVGTLAVDMVLVTLILLAFSPTPVPLDSVLSFSSFWVGPLSIPMMRLVIFLIGGALGGALALFLRKSRLGRSIRAVQMDPETAALQGVNVRRTYALTFGLGAALTSVAGLMVGTISAVRPTMGYDYLLVAFIVVILGGLGRPMGALAAAYLYAMAINVSVLVVGAGWTQAIAVGILLAVLLIRPQGILKGTDI
jgi:branched-chain amino acid transport system permease protein